ncbi:MAG: hypothetical protein SFY81_16615 [Verrucomicrobiota bacterium]|nr:hypothetical protein [Verrucomicrobiota bacterium]
MNKRLTRILPVLGTAIILSQGVIAQESTPAEARETTPPEKPEAPAASPISGTLSLDVNTHFISYGADVWAAGNKWNDVLFNPSFELNIAANDQLKFIIGTWFDINDNATTSIGDKIVQEMDAWIGVSYSFEKVTVKLLYQEWMYASESERIVDLVIGVSTFLNPSLTIHGRVDDGLGRETGVVAVAGISHSIPVGSVSITFPLNVAFATDEYHGGDAGYAFASLGASASIPLPFMPGNWSLNPAITGYHTNDDVIPGNPDEAFVTGKIGLTLAF